MSGFTYWSHDVGGFVAKGAAGSLSPLAGLGSADFAHTRRMARRPVSRGNTTRP